jgi:hypothetical protein
MDDAYLTRYPHPLNLNKRSFMKDELLYGQLEALVYKLGIGIR